MTRGADPDDRFAGGDMASKQLDHSLRRRASSRAYQHKIRVLDGLKVREVGIALFG